MGQDSQLHEALDRYVAKLDKLGYDARSNLRPGPERTYLEDLFASQDIPVHSDVIELFSWSAGQVAFGPYDLFSEVSLHDLHETIDMYIDFHRWWATEEDEPAVLLDYPVLWYWEGTSNRVYITNREECAGSVWMGWSDKDPFGDPRFRCFDALADAVDVAGLGLDMGWYRIDQDRIVADDRVWEPSEFDVRFPPFYNGDYSDL